MRSHIAFLIGGILLTGSFALTSTPVSAATPVNPAPSSGNASTSLLTPGNGGYALATSKQNLPSGAACGDFAAATKYITVNGASGGTEFGLAQLSYSSCTRDSWGYTQDYVTCDLSTASNCIIADMFQSNTNTESCETGFAGAQYTQNECNTAPASDAGITSYTYAYMTAGDGYQFDARYGQTSSY